MRSTRDPGVIKAMEPAQLVEEYRSLVGSIVNKLRRQWRIRIPVEDLEAYGFEGLLEAQQRFDPEEGVFFSTYAYYRIRGNVIDGCRREGLLTRDRQRDARRAVALDALLESNGEANRASPEASAYNEALARVTEMVDASVVVVLLAELDVEALSVQAEQHEQLERAAESAGLQRAMETLSRDERDVIHRHHLMGESLGELANAYGKSRSWVSRVNTRALLALRDVLQEGEG